MFGAMVKSVHVSNLYSTLTVKYTGMRERGSVLFFKMSGTVFQAGLGITECTSLVGWLHGSCPKGIQLNWINLT